VKTQNLGWRIRTNRSLLTSCIALLLTNPPALASCLDLDGSFLQLTEVQTTRPTADWQELIGELRSIGIGNLFLQWTIFDQKAFFEAARFETVPNSPLPTILRVATGSNIRVWVGLATDSNYWEEIKQSPDLLRSYFHNRLRDLSNFLDDLNNTVSGILFGGWYIADEIDDRTWLEVTKKEILKQYLKDTVKMVKARRPGSNVAISGFSNSFADPSVLASFWADIMASSGIDLLLFQDGIGEGKVAIENIALYYGSLSSAVQNVGRQLRAVVEVFSLLPNGKRVPAPIGRIREQISVATRLTGFPPVAFSVPDYMSNTAGGQAGNLLSSFRSAQRGCRGLRNKPTNGVGSRR
jgi:hypothetical protein